MNRVLWRYAEDDRDPAATDETNHTLQRRALLHLYLASALLPLRRPRDKVITKVNVAARRGATGVRTASPIRI